MDWDEFSSTINWDSSKKVCTAEFMSVHKVDHKGFTVYGILNEGVPVAATIGTWMRLGAPSSVFIIEHEYVQPNLHPLVVRIWQRLASLFRV